MLRKIYHAKGTAPAQDEARNHARANLVSLIKGRSDILDTLTQKIMDERTKIWTDAFAKAAEDMSRPFGSVLTRSSLGQSSSIFQAIAYGMSGARVSQLTDRPIVNENGPAVTDVGHDIVGDVDFAAIEARTFFDSEVAADSIYLDLLFGSRTCGMYGIMDDLRTRTVNVREPLVIANPTYEDMYKGHPKAQYFRMQDQAERGKRRTKREPRARKPGRVFSR